MNKKRKNENASIQAALNAKKNKPKKKAVQPGQPEVDRAKIESLTRRRMVQGIVVGKDGTRRPGSMVEVVEGLDSSIAGTKGLKATLAKIPAASVFAFQGTHELEVRDAANMLQGGTRGSKKECLELAHAFGIPEDQIVIKK